MAETETATVAASDSTTSSVSASAASGVLRKERRPMPDLDGRPDPGPDAGEVLLWVPRVLFSPLHLVFEWGIRKPLGALLTVAERDQWSNLIIDFFTFEDRKIGVVPTFFYDFNFRPSVGLYIFWNELFVKEHSIRLTGGYGGDDWYRLTFADRWALADRSQLSFSFSVWGRPDYIYTGLGLDGDPDNRGRYFSEYIDGAASVLVRPWRSSELRFEAGIRQYRFSDGAADQDEVTISEGVAAGLFALPPAFEDGYFSNFQQALVRIDSRQPRPNNGSGGLAEIYLKHGWDMNDPSRREWMGYGGQLAGFVDVGQYRVLSLSAQAHLVNPVGDREVPFTELFILGRRPQDLAGFLPGTFIGRSAAVLTLEYSYPIWVFLDGALQVSVGNAFGENFEDFDFDALRASIGLGIKGTLLDQQDNEFTLLFALGTSRFDEAFAIDTFRFLVGTQTGF